MYDLRYGWNFWMGVCVCVCAGYEASDESRVDMIDAFTSQ